MTHEPPNLNRSGHEGYVSQNCANVTWTVHPGESFYFLERDCKGLNAFDELVFDLRRKRVPFGRPFPFR